MVYFTEHRRLKLQTSYTVSRNTAMQVVLHLKTARRKGSTPQHRHIANPNDYVPLLEIFHSIQLKW